MSQTILLATLWLAAPGLALAAGTPRVVSRSSDNSTRVAGQDSVRAQDYGAKADGRSDDAAALAMAAAAAVARGVDLDLGGGTYVIGSAAVLGGVRIRGGGGTLIVRTSALNAMTISSGFTIRHVIVRAQTTYPSSTKDTQRIFFAPSRSTGVSAEDVYVYANTPNDTGSTRGGEVFRGYFAQSRFSGIHTRGMRNAIFAEGEDVSSLTVDASTFEDVERGVYVTGLNPHVGKPLVSRGYIFVANKLVNTSVQASNYHAVEGRALYNLQNIGGVSISGSVSEYAIERAIYIVCCEDITIDGVQVRGSEGIKLAGTQYDGTVPGGPVDRKVRNVTISNVNLTNVAADKEGIILQFVDGVTVDRILADGNNSQANAAVYIDSSARAVTISHVRAHDFKRGLVWFRAVRDLPSTGGVPARPSGSYNREFRDIVIEDCEGDQVATLGSDATHVPAHTVPFIYTLVDEDLARTLTGASRLWYDLTIRRNTVNPTASNGGGTWRYRSTSMTKAFLDLNYVERVRIEGNNANDIGGASLLGINVGSASTDVLIRHEAPQVTNYDSVSAVVPPLFASIGSEISFRDTAGSKRNAHASYSYRVVPVVLTDGGNSAERGKTQDLTTAYRVIVEIQATLAQTGSLHLGGPEWDRHCESLTGGLSPSTAGFVTGEVTSDDGQWWRWSLAPPWTTPRMAAGTSSGFKIDTASCADGSGARQVRLTNGTAKERRVRAVTEYCVQRTAARPVGK